MLIYIDHAVEEAKASCRREGRAYARDDLYDAIMFGAVERVRPKMMTVVAIVPAHEQFGDPEGIASIALVAIQRITTAR